jgi:hypothetical protein
MTDVSKERAAALVIKAIIETIEEMGTEGAPMGIMFHALCGMISYESFMNVIDALQNAGIIRVSNHVAYRVQR